VQEGHKTANEKTTATRARLGWGCWLNSDSFVQGSVLRTFTRVTVWAST